ncbi:Cytosolic copper metallochaperone [Savitreella phatthalungensis]
MACGACSNAISKVLSRTSGVSGHDISLEQQTVTVTVDDQATLSIDQVQQRIANTGREIKSAQQL